VAAQDKWVHSEEKFTLLETLQEMVKNIRGILSTSGDFLKCLLRFRLITVFFVTVTHAYDCDPAELPYDCLLIVRQNFKEYFGPVFSERANFMFSQRVNPNFAGADMMRAVLPGVGKKKNAKNIVLKRPYHDEKDFYDKHPLLKKQCTELCFYPFNL
jgi:hypothetical protein